MASLTELRAELKALDAEIMALHHDRNAPGGLREFTSKEQTQYDALLAEREELREKVSKHDDIARGAKDSRRRVDAVRTNDNPKRVNVNYRSAGKAWQVRDNADGDELRGRAVDALEGIGASDEAIERALGAMYDQADAPAENNELARRIAVCSSPDYARAFAKLARDPISGHNTWTGAERAAWDAALEARASMASGAGATGLFAVPTHLDPTVIITNDGSSNVIRSISREVSLSVGNTWNGISSDGVSASYDTEASEVSDDSPTLAQPAIDAHMARAMVVGSMEVFDDIPNLQSEVLRLFHDAKDRLEETKFTVGSGSGEPTGVFTTIAATTASRVVSTTAATIGVVDLKAVYRAVPARHRRVARWLSNPLYTLAVKDLGTAVNASFSGDLRDPAASRWYDLPVVESDDAPETQTTTALDSEILLGDFSQFVIVDRIGASAEFIPHMFSTANNLPSGQRGVFFRFRSGSGVVNTGAFRLLVDKTSA